MRICLLNLFWCLTTCAVILTACDVPTIELDYEQAAATQTSLAAPSPTALPVRPQYEPGTLVDYIAQSGDTLPALASHFNTTVEEIREANLDLHIPADATTMPPGMPMKIPIYYMPFWGTPFKILPDSLFVNGQTAIGFDTETFLSTQRGWLKDFRGYAGSTVAGANLTGAEIIDLIATYYSINPRFLLAILEYQTGALSQTNRPATLFPLGYRDFYHMGLYLQLIWAANTLNNGYYGWRTGNLDDFEHIEGNLERPDPWQNAATVGLHYYFSRIMSRSEYDRAISSEGFAQTYRDFFGDTWAEDQFQIPASLQQPPLRFPFQVGEAWSYTGGPHTGWGEGEPYAAIDFAPPAEIGGCTFTGKWAVALADGLVVRTGVGIVVLDLDKDGDERTGWVIFYLHVSSEDRVMDGTSLQAGEPVGHPSCEGGESTGTHIHIARKFNGEWISAYGPLAYNLEGWIVNAGNEPYYGTLIRGEQIVTACKGCTNTDSVVEAGK